MYFLDELVIMWKHMSSSGNEKILAVDGNLYDKTDTRIVLETETNGNNLAIYLAEIEDEGEYICQVVAYNTTEIKYSVEIKGTMWSFGQHRVIESCNICTKLFCIYLNLI